MSAAQIVGMAVLVVVLAGPVALGLTGWLRTRGGPARPNSSLTVRASARTMLRSTLLCTLAFNLTFFVQELFLVLPKALTPGLRPTLFHNNHFWEGTNPLAGLLQGTGALAILASGVFFLRWAHRRRGSTAWRAFYFWMAYCGLFMALPQVVVGAVSAQSDVGRALTYLGLGAVAKATLALGALVAIPVSAFALRRPLFASATNAHAIASARARTAFVFRTVTLPALAALPLIVLFRVPREWIEVVMVPAVVLVVGVVWLQASAWIATDATPARHADEESIAWPLGAVALLLAIFQGLLRPGIAFY